MKKIIFTGKGGVGKTTILSNLVRLLVLDKLRVLAIDCDPSMNLATSLGIPLSQVVSIAEDKAQFQEKLERSMRSYGDEDEDDDHYGDEDEDDDHYGDEDGVDYHNHGAIPNQNLSEYIVKTPDSVNLIVMGTIPFGGAGCLCAPIAMVKMLVSYLSSCNDEYDIIIVDSQAGVEIFGRGLASEFDLALIVTEPTPKALDVARHGSKLAQDLAVKKQIAIANKVENISDLKAAEKALKGCVDLIIPMEYDKNIKKADKKGILLLDYASHSSAMND
ncbi:MAG TPA: AAA family ATPase, partial [Methanospirillum sp.]|uniref:ATP-binding protein n=1 Tax=Methanospirillum sp. TaxID=45200 RepID=UPI002B90B0FA